MKFEFGYRRKKRKKKNDLISFIISIYLAAYLTMNVFEIDQEYQSVFIILITIINILMIKKFESFIDKRRKNKVKKRIINSTYTFKLKEILIVIVPYLYFTNRSEFNSSFTVDIMIVLMIPVYIIIKFNLIETFRMKISYKSITMSKVDKMSGEDFEAFLEETFEKLGYKVFRTQLSGDFGADLVIENSKEKVVVQAKRYSKNVGVTAVQEVVTAKKYYECTNAIVVTNSYYTKPAIELAKVNKVKLYDRDWLEDNIFKFRKTS